MTALDHYCREAPQLGPRYLRLDPRKIYAPVLRFLPATPARIADIGAGPGRDARWLTGLGHHVTAVEPVAGFCATGMAQAPRARWLDASLPRLDGVEGPFDLLLMNAVWHHLDPDKRLAALRRLRSLAVRGGRLILSLRHGAGPEALPIFPVRAEDTFATAKAAGFSAVFSEAAPAIQDGNRIAGVRWTWLVLQAEDHVS